MYKESISNEELSLLPIGSFEGDIVIVENELTMDQAYNDLSKQSVIGFDTETRPSFQKGKINNVALLQLSTADKAYLIRVNSIKFSTRIKSIFQDEKILKIGASIRDDIRILQHVKTFRPKGFIDLQNIIGNYGIKELSVRKMSAIVLGIKISKAQRLSNWEANSLTHAQQLYAATDAWVCREIFLKVSEQNR